ncbi:MAG: AMP-binding protein [Sphaerochaetaceae bacterium]|jgi:long-chain acyl-CoA synthetase|nr:AMP-binding protein [Sphaerochaetaceae bacterium]MDD3671421.1 AMP-binding protein [Sphaerochaetaceae bacterium]MDD4259461.1 AMP-binding protein [Sphaerochaetaceae bacterium]MDX9933565.1 AMP-binding protein [Sphaerochaetaceae bacterium]NLO59835.1 long-chain fatty acid--CoA ligase [Spirochaetales bacterium]
MAKNKVDVRPWDFLAEYRGTVFEGEWPTIPQMFEITVKRHPSNRCFTAFSPVEMTLTYAEVLKKVKQVSGYLHTKGIGLNSKVAVTGKNSPEWAIAYLAILFTGATVVPLDFQLKDEEINFLLKFAGVEYLFIDAERIDDIDKQGNIGLVEKISLEPNHPNYVMDLDGSFDEHTEKASESDLAAILFTSGTTGNPKGVMLSHSNLVSDCYLAQDLLTVLPTDVFYALLPIHHSYTMLAVFIEAISIGSEIVFGKKLIVTQILKELKKGKVTMFLAVPMLFNKMLKGLMNGIKEKGALVYGLIRFLMGISGFIKKVFRKNPGNKMFKGILEKLSLDNIRICICGGGPLPASTFKMFNQLGIDFVQGYGLTETSPILTLNPIDAYIETSVGKVLPRTEMKIIDTDEKGVGEITVRGPMVMQGYYKNPEATAEILDENRWLKTGDAGYLDANNYLYLTGRKKSLIVTEGGKNVFPEEIEDEFQLYDEIDQICVLGFVLDEKMKTEGIRALVHPSEKFVDEMKQRFPDDKQRKAEMNKHMDEIVEKVNKDLLPYKRISRVDLVDEPFEMSSTKKIKRFIYAEKYKYL